MSAKEPNDGPKIGMTQDVVNKVAGRFAEKQIRDSKINSNQTRTYACRTNSALPDRSWQVVDETVYDTQDDTLTLVQDLLDMGLRNPADLMTKHDTWPLIDDRGEANIAMTPEVDSDEGALTWADEGVPVPMIYDFFTLGFREGQSDNSGASVEASMDTLGASTTTRRVNERIEQLFIDGWSETIEFDGEGYTLYGLTNHPQTNTDTFDADWTSDNTVIRSDIRRMRSVIKNDNNFRPGGTGYMLYLGTTFYDELDDADPEGDGNVTVRDRVENLSNIRDVKELDYLGDKEALMFRPTEDVVDVGVAADVQPVMWDDPFRDYWSVLGSVYPRVKSTLTGQSGVVHFTL